MTCAPRLAIALLGIGSLAIASCSAERAGDPVPPSSSVTSDAHSDLCLSRQKGGFLGVHAAVQRLTRIALSRPEHVPAAALERVRYRVTVLPDETDPPCSAPLTPLRQSIDALEPGALDEDALRRVVDEVNRWRSALGTRSPAPILFVADYCVPFREHVHVTYDVRYDRVAAGRVGRLMLTLANDWDRPVTIGHSGRVEIRGHQERPFSRRVRWDSSTYTFGAGPGHTTSRPVFLGSGRSRHVPLAPDGRFARIRVEAEGFIYAQGWCDLGSVTPE